MAIERQNNISSKLDRLDYIPEGFAFDRNTAWKKINGRLSSKSKKKIALYAAVLIPLTVAISWIFIGDKKGKDEVVVTVPAKPAKPSERLLTTSEENIIVQKNLSSQSIVKPSPGKNEKNAATTSQQTKKSVIVGSSANNIPAEEVIVAAPSPDTVAVAAVPKPKYKHKIVHINEIDEMPMQPSDVATQKSLRKPLLATMSEMPNVNDSKLAHEKKKLFSFLPVSSQ